MAGLKSSRAQHAANCPSVRSYKKTGWRVEEEEAYKAAAVAVHVRAVFIGPEKKPNIKKTEFISGNVILKKYLTKYLNASSSGPFPKDKKL